LNPGTPEPEVGVLTTQWRYDNRIWSHGE
jgi:hypothetical protein